MAVIAGVDGIEARWLALMLDTSTGQLTTSVVPSAALKDLTCDVLAIDVPIGLSESERREADTLARAVLRPSRASTVFPSPIRPVLECLTRSEASVRSQQICGRGVSAQAFALFSKIRDIRNLIKSDRALATRVYEIHPEVSFASWAHAPMRYSKNVPEGQQERQALIADHFGSGVFAAVQAASKARLPVIDLADAFAALWSAARILEGKAHRLPAEPCVDADGLPAHIWY